MKGTFWLKDKHITLFIGGDPSKGQAPEITIELSSPQFIVDDNKVTVVEAALPASTKK